jgi:hypothetical protein
MAAEDILIYKDFLKVWKEGEKDGNSNTDNFSDAQEIKNEMDAFVDDLISYLKRLSTSPDYSRYLKVNMKMIGALLYDLVRDAGYLATYNK